MRVWIPPGAGLGASEVAALKRLSRPSLELIAEELREPGSHEAIRWILRQRNPEAALAQVVAENVQHVVRTLTRNPGAGMGDLLGKSFFKKLVKTIKKVTITIPKKIASAVAKHDPLYKAVKPTLTKVAKAVRKNLPIIMTVAGAVLSVAFPPFAPVILAGTSVLTTARQLYAARIDTAKAVKAGKAEANAMQAQVDQQTAQVNQQADDVYAQAQSTFQAAGWDQASWNALTLDQKINLIQGMQNGQIPVNPAQQAALLAAQQQAAQQVNQTATQAATQAATSSTAPQFDPSQFSQVASPSAPSSPDTSGAPPSGSVPPQFSNVLPSSTSTSSAPTAGPEQTDETAGLPTASGYTVNVEGKPVTNYPVDLASISAIVQSATQPGDRFEISADGVGTGLRVRTAGGFISIPDSMRAQVMAMPHDQVLALLQQAAANVAAAGGPAGQDPTGGQTSGGGGMLWLLLGGGAALALARGGKRR